MQSWLTHLFANFKGFFASPKVKAAEAEVVTLMPAAMGIVSEIDALAPNKTLDEFNTIATKYALPTITALGAGQTPGNVALNLGSAILAKNHAPAAATLLLNTVIQNAAFLLKASPTVAVAAA
jgi:hypothetical protein